jgi:hypothetical protein
MVEGAPFLGLGIWEKMTLQMKKPGLGGGEEEGLGWKMEKALAGS